MRLFLAALFIAVFIPARASAITNDDITYLEGQFGIAHEDYKQGDNSYSQSYRNDLERSVDNDIQNGDLPHLAQRMDQALYGYVKYASTILWAKGEYDKSNQILNEYNHTYSNEVQRLYLTGFRDVGDHPPLSDWLSIWYSTLVIVLGERTVELLHLDDINTLNYTIPVVFQPCGDKRFPPPVPWGGEEYSKHFVPFSGVVSYWVSWGACVGATWGAGAIGLVCVPIAEIIRKGVEHYIAPPLSDRVYNYFVPSRCQGV